MKTRLFLPVVFAFLIFGTAAIFAAAPETSEPAAEPEDGYTLDVKALGDAGAPVRIDEFASLTCTHCADFHKKTFPQLKKDYIDTGKVYFVFHDFPLNMPALDASMVARCLPEDKYFKFISFLFDSQERWAFEGDYRQNLTQNAKLIGTGEETIDACLKNEDLRRALVEGRAKASTDYQIDSTPTFVFNGKAEDKISGAESYKTFQKKIDSLLEQNKTSQ